MKGQWAVELSSGARIVRWHERVAHMKYALPRPCAASISSRLANCDAAGTNTAWFYQRRALSQGQRPPVPLLGPAVIRRFWSERSTLPIAWHIYNSSESLRRHINGKKCSRPARLLNYGYRLECHKFCCGNILQRGLTLS